MTILEALAALERREVITTDPKEREQCCGLPRDEDGFCSHRAHHPVFVDIGLDKVPDELAEEHFGV